MTCHIFIPSYHRPHNIKTVNYFERIGWPVKKLTVFIDSEADDRLEYRQEAEERGFNLVVFDMQEARERYDYVHRPSPALRSAGQARNMFQDYAKDKSIDFYCVQDDDTVLFQIRPFGKYFRQANFNDIDTTFTMIEMMMKKWRIGLFGLSQTGEMFEKFSNVALRNKVMNCSFYLPELIYRAERGVQDDDTSMFVNVMNEGLFCASLRTGLVLNQVSSVTQEGGLTDLYKECQLLNKSLVCPIQLPSCITATRQRKIGNRLHHKIASRYLYPKIVKGKRSNIAWDTYPEDTPFTLEPEHRRNGNRGIHGRLKNEE